MEREHYDLKNASIQLESKDQFQGENKLKILRIAQIPFSSKLDRTAVIVSLILTEKILEKSTSWKSLQIEQKLFQERETRENT